MRFDDRVTGKVEKFAKHGTIVHIDIDASEINKNKVVRLPIIANVKKWRSRGSMRCWRGRAGSARPLGSHDRFPEWYADHPGVEETIPAALQGQRIRT